MDYSYLNQAGFDPSSAMSSLQSAAAATAAVSSEANFYSDLSGSCPSVSAAMMPGNYGPLTGRYPVMRSPYGHSSGMPGTPTGSPSSSFPRNPPEHHRQSMFGASSMGLNCKFLKNVKSLKSIFYYIEFQFDICCAMIHKTQSPFWISLVTLHHWKVFLRKVRNSYFKVLQL